MLNFLRSQFYLVLLFMIAPATKAEPFYDLIRIEANRFGTNRGPEWTNTAVVAINGSGTVAGSFYDTNGWASAFLWRDGVVTKVETGIPEEHHATPMALNNHDEVVGLLMLSDGTYAVHRAWLHSGGASYILGPAGITNGIWNSYARDINDAGVVVGEVDGDGFVFRPELVRFPDLGGGPCWSGQSKLTLVNNNGMILGDSDQVPYRWRSLSQPESWEHVSALNPIALNESNVVAGTFDSRPALWDGKNVTFLSAPEDDARPVAINDLGIVIGQARTTKPSSATEGTFGPRPGQPLIWKRTTALDLATLVELPMGARLEPVGINNAGMIVANLSVDGGKQGVVLKPRVGMPLPDVSISVPTEKVVVRSNDLKTAAVVRSNHRIAKVTYTLYSRVQIPSHGMPPCWWTAPSIRSVAVMTNEAAGAPFTATFTNLATGQYAWEATVELESGVVAYSHRAYAVVTAPPVLRVRESWKDEIDVAVEGRGGYLNQLEVSSDLVNWTALTNGAPASGMLISEGAAIRTNVARRFYRARVVNEDPDVFPEIPTFSPEPQPPDSLSGRTLTVYFGGGGYQLFFVSDGILRMDDLPQVPYVWNPALRRLRYSGDWGEEELTLRPNTWWDWNGSCVSRYKLKGEENWREIEGVFILSRHFEELEDVFR